MSHVMSDTAPGMGAARPSLLSKERTVAPPGFNRWLVPPAALAIHLCIGMAYGFSVFWLPLSKAIGIKEALKCGPEVGFLQQLFTTSCDWPIATLGWMYTLFFVLLGSSAAIWGGWLERVTDGSRCFLATEEQRLVSSVLRAFPEEFAAHIEQRSCPQERPRPMPKLVDLADGHATYDETFWRKRPDWTYEPE